jgi:hypothetical protein
MLILPRRYTSQPPKRSRVDASHPILAGVSNAIIQYGDVSGWRGNNATGDFGSLIQDPTLNGTLASDYTDAGPALKFDGSTTYADFGTSNIPTDEFTVLWGGVFDALTGVTGIVDCSNGTSNGWSLYTSGTDMYLSGNHYAGDLLASGWATGTFYHGAARNKSGVGTSIFRNGAKIANSGTTLSGVSNPTNPFLVGQLRVSSPRFITARFAYFYLFDRYLDDQQIADIAVNPYRIFSPQRKLYLVGSPSSGINLAVANCSQANSANTGAIAQTHVITVASSGQANQASASSITQVHALAVANSSQANAASTGSIAGGANLTAAPSAQTNPSSTGSVTQVHALVAAPGVQGNVAAASVIVQAHILITANLAQGNLGGTGAISLSTGNLIGSPSVQSNLGGTGVIALVGVVSDAFRTPASVSAGIKKPGIPATAPDWLRTSLEILEGRRGNAIEIPAQQTLAFSATPTKAECEALYQYTNTVRDAVESILNRLDG